MMEWYWVVIIASVCAYLGVVVGADLMRRRLARSLETGQSVSFAGEWVVVVPERNMNDSAVIAENRLLARAAKGVNEATHKLLESIGGMDYVLAVEYDPELAEDEDVRDLAAFAVKVTEAMDAAGIGVIQ